MVPKFPKFYIKKTNSTCSFWLEVWQSIEKYQDEVAYILQQFQVSSEPLSCTLGCSKKIKFHLFENARNPQLYMGMRSHMTKFSLKTSK